MPKQQQQLSRKIKEKNFSAKAKLKRSLSGPKLKLGFGYSSRKTKEYGMSIGSSDTDLSQLGSGYAINFHPTKFAVSSRSTKFGRCTVVQGQTWVTAVQSSATPGAGADGIFNGARFFAVRPQAFARLNTVAPLYTKFRFTKMKWDYVTSCPVTVTGNFVLGWFSDGNVWNDSEYAAITYQDISTNESASYISVKEPMGTLTVGQTDLGVDKLYYSDYHSTGTPANDVSTNRQSIQGTLSGIFGNRTVGTGYGDLFVEYECELYDAVTKDPVPLLSLSPDTHIPVPKSTSLAIFNRNPHATCRPNGNYERKMQVTDGDIPLLPIAVKERTLRSEDSVYSTVPEQMSGWVRIAAPAAHL